MASTSLPREVSGAPLPRVNMARCEAELRRRMAAAQPAAEMALLHMAAGAPDRAHKAIDYGLDCVAEISEGDVSQRLLDPIQFLTRHGGVNNRVAGFLESAGVGTVRDLIAADPKELLRVRNAGPADYQAAMVAAAKYLAGLI